MTDAKQKALNSLAKGAGVTAVAMLFSKALTYLYRITIARFVGPEAYGQLSLALMVVGLASTISMMSFNASLKKFIPEYRTRNEKGRIKGIVLGSLHITVPVSLLMSGLVFFGAEFIATRIFDNPALTSTLQIMSGVPFFGTMSGIFLNTTVGFNKILYRSVTNKVVQNLIQLILTVVLLFVGFEVAGAAWGYLAGTIAAAILGFYFMEVKVGPIISSNVKPEYQYRKIIAFSSPLLLSGIITTVLSWADTALLGYYMTDFEVGLYNAALPTAMLIMLPNSAIGSLALSSFSELKEKEEEKLESSLQTATYWVFSITFPTFLILLFFSGKILRLLFGSQYIQASSVLSILAVGYLANASVGKVSNLLQSKGYTQYILYNNVAALALNIILNIALIPIYGIIGAAIATASSIILTNLLMFAEVWKKEGLISIHYQKTIKVIITSIAPLLAVIGLDNILFINTPYWFLFIAAAIYFSLYAVLFLKILGLGEEEKEVIMRVGELSGYEETTERIIREIENRF